MVAGENPSSKWSRIAPRSSARAPPRGVDGPAVAGNRNVRVLCVWFHDATSRGSLIWSARQSCVAAGGLSGLVRCLRGDPCSVSAAFLRDSPHHPRWLSPLHRYSGVSPRARAMPCSISSATSVSWPAGAIPASTSIRAAPPALRADPSVSPSRVGRLSTRRTSLPPTTTNDWLSSSPTGSNSSPSSTSLFLHLVVFVNAFRTGSNALRFSTSSSSNSALHSCSLSKRRSAMAPSVCARGLVSPHSYLLRMYVPS